MDPTLREEVILWERKHAKKHRSGNVTYEFTSTTFPPNRRELLQKITAVEIRGSFNDPAIVTALYNLYNLEHICIIVHDCEFVLAKTEWSRFPSLRVVIIDLLIEAPAVEWHFDGCEKLQSVSIDGGNASTALTSLCSVSSLTKLSIHDSNVSSTTDMDFSVLTKLEHLYLSCGFSQFPRGLGAASNLTCLVFKIALWHSDERVVIPRELENTSITKLTIMSPAPIEWELGYMENLTDCTVHTPNILEILDDVIHWSPNLHSLSSEMH